MLKAGDMVQTPHARPNRFYVVREIMENYSNGMARVRMQEIGASVPAIQYPADMLTRVGIYG